VGLGPERRVDLHFMRTESLRAIRHQSPNGAQQEAYGRRECIGKMPVTGQSVLEADPIFDGTTDMDGQFRFWFGIFKLS
jgi:hypothetical protein